MEEVAVTGTVAQAPRLLELVMVEGREAPLVQAAEEAPLGPIQVYSPLCLVVHHQAVEVGVVPATVLAVPDMVEVRLGVVARAIPLWAPEVEEGMDPTAVEALPRDVEVDRGDIRVVLAEVILHSHLPVEGDIPMAPHRHRIVRHHLVVPATAKEAMTLNRIKIMLKPPE